VWQDAQWNDTGTTLYRYYREAACFVQLVVQFLELVIGRQHAHGPSLEVRRQSESYAKMEADPEVSDPLTASDFQVSQYADFYFEYDSQRRVTKEVIQGGSRTYTFGYTESAHATSNNSWKTATVETLPAGDRTSCTRTTRVGPCCWSSRSGTDEWCEFWKYKRQCPVVLHANRRDQRLR